MELLSPAGTWEAMVAAVQAGADAVYLGGTVFNARQYAGNFDEEQLKLAVEYCHVRDVKVYVTVNILVADKEMSKLGEYIVYVYNIGVDAVIVQDLGVARFIREITPDFELHASTQMTIHNLEGVQVLERLGFRRVVLARELSAEDIRYICKNTSLEIEVFVHGALCMSYSGQCLMSSIIGGRSGNRGRCAQPCRLPYELVDLNTGRQLHKDKKAKYLLSLKDLNLIEHLELLKEIGVKSLKIEGRMKRPEYVALVTQTYRRYMDTPGSVEESDHQLLLQAFNRGGFTQGFFAQQQSVAEPGAAMMSSLKPNNWGVYIGDVTAYDHKRGIASIELKSGLMVGDGIEIRSEDGRQFGMNVHGLVVGKQNIQSAKDDDNVDVEVKDRVKPGDKVYKTFDLQSDRQAKQFFTTNVNIRKIPVYGECSISNGWGIMIHLWDDQGNHAEFTGDRIAEKAIHKPLEADKIMEQIGKFGGTPFELASIKLNVEPGLSLPISELNHVRRNVIQALELKRIQKYIPSPVDVNEVKRFKIPKGDKNDSCVPKRKLQISVQIHDYFQAEQILRCGVDRLYIPVSILLNNENKRKTAKIVENFQESGTQIVCILPRIILQAQMGKYSDMLAFLQDMDITTVMIGSIGQLNMFEPFKQYHLLGDYGLNVFNSLTACELKSLNLQGVTLSPEMTLKQIKSLDKLHEVKYEIITYGRLPLMIMENCPVGGASEYIDEKSKCHCSSMQYGLLDRKGAVFPILKDRSNCRNEILNSQVIYLADHMQDVMSSGVDYARLLFTTEKPEQCREIVLLYKEAIKNTASMDRDEGKNSKLIQDLLKQGFTRGHYFRGVE